MERIKKRIANLKVEGKLKVYQITVLVMTLFLVLVAPVSYTHLYGSMLASLAGVQAANAPISRRITCRVEGFVNRFG